MKIIKIVLFLILSVFNCFSSLFCETKNNNEFRINSEIDRELVNRTKGVYLPEKYINELKINKSHVKASKTLDNDVYSAIIASDNDFLCIVNFHEGGGGSITYAKNNIFKLDDFNHETYEISNKNMLKCKGVNYIKISNINNDYENIIRIYITSIIFQQNKYFLQNGESIYRNNIGNIVYKNKTYTYCLGLVFMSTEYDTIYDNNSQYTISISGDSCIIYNTIIPDEWVDDPFCLAHAKYSAKEIYKLRN